MRFDRVYRLIIGPSGKKGIEIATPFRMTFDISKDTKEEPNTTTIRVFNLKEDGGVTLQMLSEKIVRKTMDALI